MNYLRNFFIFGSFLFTSRLQCKICNFVAYINHDTVQKYSVKNQGNKNADVYVFLIQ